MCVVRIDKPTVEMVEAILTEKAEDRWPYAKATWELFNANRNGIVRLSLKMYQDIVKSIATNDYYRMDDGGIQVAL